jgi:hypothetical protein
MKALFDEALVRQAISYLILPGAVFEVRATKAQLKGNHRKGTVSGYFNNFDLLLAQLDRLYQAEGIYLTINPVNPALLSRRVNRLDYAQEGAQTKDEHILQRCWFFIDADPVRPSGISSTDREKELAHARVGAIYSYLRDRGWPSPIVADSGNGYHLLYRIDLPAKDDALVEKVLTALAGRFDDADVKIDCAVVNPARIVKLYGTFSCKGDDTPERPHRLSKILKIPPNLRTVSAEQSQAFCSELRPATTPPPMPGGRDSKPDKAQIREMLAFIPKGPAYPHWIKVIAAVGDALTDADAIEVLCEWSPEEEEGEYAAKLRQRLKDVHIGTLIYLAHQHGWKSKEARSAPAKSAMPTSNSVDEETLIQLAALPPLEYERVRKKEAEKLKCRESILDKLVEAKRLFLKPNTDTLQGKAVVLANVEPWEQAVSGAEVLEETAQRFAHYVVLPDGAADMLALWCAHAHCFKCFLCSPRLNATSAEKQSGKTTLRDVIALFVARPVLTEHMTTAVLFRLVDAQAPTILADEADSWLPKNEELRGLLNAGHRRGGKVLRCEGDNNEVREFDAYAPAMLSGIGNLPGTLHDRSIVVRLKRAKRGEIPARFDPRHVEVETALCRKLARWTADNLTQLNACDPQLPGTAFNRLADNWRPLFAIAEVAGGDWPKRCADALAKLTSCATDEVESLRVMLLADIREIFAGTWPPLPKGISPSPVERKFSRELIEMLSEMRERPWPEVCNGKPITERWLARNLGVFGIRPKLLRIGDDNRPARGYDKTDFEDAYMRYLPERGFPSVTPLQHEGKHDFSIRYKKENVTDEKTAPYIGKCNTVTLKKGENGEMDESDPSSDIFADADAALDDPLIRNAMEQFNATIHVDDPIDF